mgnify:FL=1
MGEEAPRKSYRRLLAALAALIAEYLAISFSFDAAQLLDRADAWQGLGWMGWVGPAVIAFGTALWIMSGEELLEALRRVATATPPPLARRIAVHVLCFAGFFALSARLFAYEPFPDGPVVFWVALWLLAGAASVLSLVPIAFGGVGLRALLRELAWPLALSSILAFVAMGAGLVTIELWAQLGSLTLDLVAVMLDSVISPIVFDPSEAAIGTERFWVRILPICSGYEGIGLIAVFLSAYLVLFRKSLRFPRVLVLVPAAIAAVWFLNAVRIVALILVGHYWSPDIAIGGFHSKAGWLVFCGVALGVTWLTQRSTWFARRPTELRGRIVNPSGPFLLPLLAVVGTALVTGLFIDEFDYFYPLRVIAALLVIAWYREDYAAGLREHLGARRLISWDAIAIGVAVYAIWIGASALSDSGWAEPRPEELSQVEAPIAVVWVVFRAMGSVITIPIVEELAFRGFLLRRLVGSDFTRVPYDKWHWPAVLISSLAFAAAHQQWIGGFAAGLLYAYAQKRRGLLSDAIIAHGTTNALITMQVLVGGHWGLW